MVGSDKLPIATEYKSSFPLNMSQFNSSREALNYLHCHPNQRGPARRTECICDFIARVANSCELLEVTLFVVNMS